MDSFPESLISVCFTESFYLSSYTSHICWLGSTNLPNSTWN